MIQLVFKIHYHGNWNKNNGQLLKRQKPIVYTNVLTIFQLETTQFISYNLYIFILWSEVSAKYCLLSINNRFVISNKRLSFHILVVMAKEFEEK